MASRPIEFLRNLFERFTKTSSESLSVKRISTKQFNGSNPASFYDMEYYEKGTKSNYGRYDPQSEKIFHPHQEQYYLPLRMKRAQSIVQQYQIKSALDLGCGKGFFVKAFRLCGVEAYGVDLSEYAIRSCPEDVKYYLYQGDICDLSYFKDEQFEMVIAINVLEHIAIPDLYLAIDEAVRVSNCYVMVYVKVADETNLGDKQTMISSDKGHLSVYPREWWKGELEKRGLRVLWEAKDIYPDGIEGIALIFAKSLSRTVLPQ